MFNKKKTIGSEFTTRADAFNAMLALRLDEGDDPLEAAEKADRFADIYAKNNGVPERPEPERKGVDQLIFNVDKIVTYAESHPRIVEFLTGALTFGIGLFTGNKIGSAPQPGPAEQTQQEQQAQQEPIDFDNLPGGN